jgi:hypothetical protein
MYSSIARWYDLRDCIDVRLLRTDLLVWSSSGKAGRSVRAFLRFVRFMRGGLRCRRLVFYANNRWLAGWAVRASNASFGGCPTATDLRTRLVSTVPGSEGLYTVRWSPDGRYLAAKTKDDSKMMGFDFKTGKWTEWAKIGVTMYLNWSRDGKYVYFGSALGSEPAFYRLRVGDHKLERLVSVKELGRQASGFLAPVDRPVPGTIPCSRCATSAARRFMRWTGKHCSLRFFGTKPVAQGPCEALSCNGYWATSWIDGAKSPFA